MQHLIEFPEGSKNIFCASIKFIFFILCRNNFFLSFFHLHNFVFLHFFFLLHSNTLKEKENLADTLDNISHQSTFLMHNKAQ